MLKKYISLIMCAVMVVSVCGCSKDKKDTASPVVTGTNVSVYEVSEALNVSYPPESIYREICGDDGKSVTIADRISDDRAEGFISDIILYDALDKLSLRDRNIIKLTITAKRRKKNVLP